MKATPNDQIRNLNFKISAAMYRRFRLKAAAEDMKHVEYLEYLMDLDQALTGPETGPVASRPNALRRHFPSQGLCRRVWAAVRNQPHQ